MKLDERYRLGRIVGAAVDRARMPAKGEEAHRLDALDVEFERKAGMGLLQLRDLRIDLRRCDPPRESSPGDALALELDAEPAPELLRFAHGAPDTLARRTQDDSLLDAVGDRAHSATSRLHEIGRASCRERV